MASWMTFGPSKDSRETSIPLDVDSIPPAALVNRKKKSQQPRQLLSCKKCRERKVKCDRTKPCSACCARGLPKECHFVLGEDTDHGPIQQSLELRKLRTENQRLKERLLAARVPLSDDSEDDDGPSNSRLGLGQRRTSRQRRFRIDEHTDSLYFGSPGLASVVSDFANLQMEPKSLAHTMPRGADMYAAHRLMYPFPALWTATSSTHELLACLQPYDELFTYLDCFTKKAQGFVFPYLPDELTKKEVENFLADAETNATKFPDYLALIFSAAALGEQLASDDLDGSMEIGERLPSQSRKGVVFAAAAMHSLRTSSFMSQPTLISIQALLILGPYLTNSGRFLDAWSLFGTSIRLAHSIGLHRNPKLLDPVPPLRECSIRSTLWWWLLHADQQYSMTLGRPLGISGIGDCPPAEPLTTNPAVIRLGEVMAQLTILARQILSSVQLADSKIDGFTDKLIGLWDTMPNTLQFNNTWVDETHQLPEWPLGPMAAIYYSKIHNYIILLNRQRMEIPRASPDNGSISPGHSQPRTFVMNQSLRPAIAITPEEFDVPRGRPLVIRSSLALLDVLVFLYKRVPTALIDWTVGQQSFNACMILLLDALETGNIEHIGRVEQAYAIFVQMDKKRVHQLAALAVSRISEGLLRLRDMVTSRPVSVETVQRSSSSSRHHTPNDEMLRSKSATSASTVLSEPVMGTTGMFLLEDHGLQSHSARSFVGQASEPLPQQLQAQLPDSRPLSAQQRQGSAFRPQPQQQPFQIPAGMTLAIPQEMQMRRDSVQQSKHNGAMLTPPLIEMTNAQALEEMYFATQQHQQQQGYAAVVPSQQYHMQQTHNLAAAWQTQALEWEAGRGRRHGSTAKRSHR